MIQKEKKGTLAIIIDYDNIGDFYCIESNVKTEKIRELLLEFLSFQFSKGVDNSPPRILDLYQIDIGIDLDFDKFFDRHNCGNLGLRDGILLHLIQKMKDRPLKSRKIISTRQLMVFK